MQEFNGGVVVAHMVNIRSRASPSLRLESASGNGCFLTSAPISSESSLSCVVSELRRGIRKIDYEYVRQAHEEDRYLIDLDELFGCEAPPGEHLGMFFTSWCRFPTYEVDFGWGKPVWVCTVGFRFNNFAILMSNKSGDGIEVWINLLPENIESFEANWYYQRLRLAIVSCNAVL